MRCLFRFKLVMITSALLCACSNELDHVKVISAVDAKMMLPQKPKLAISMIRSDMRSAEIIHCYVTSLNQCMSYAEQQKTLLGAYQ
jgi:hypothetical protein